ncbi:MAG: DUF72 domain-containing protein [Solirubrobacteraceae bacterium]|nr:MAG: hypothetical protein DLM63_01155 [Solirubrobacterales bacterium]
MGALRIGCSGWQYRDWRGSLYPPGVPTRRWLEAYAERFNTVEVNSTFYRLPSREAVAQWVKQTPAGFVFAVKASRYLTHVKRLAEISGGVQRFYERIELLVKAQRLGPVLWQLPENFHRDDDRLASALDVLPAGRHTFEFRHASWFVEEVMALLRAHNVALAIGDHPQRPFQTADVTADFVFVRFHHGSRGRGGNYSASELEAWASRLARWRARHDVFAYFNNDWKAYAPRNAAALAALLAQAEPRSARAADRVAAVTKLLQAPRKRYCYGSVELPGAARTRAAEPQSAPTASTLGWRPRPMVDPDSPSTDTPRDGRFGQDPANPAGHARGGCGDADRGRDHRLWGAGVRPGCARRSARGHRDRRRVLRRVRGHRRRRPAV